MVGIPEMYQTAACATLVIFLKLFVSNGRWGMAKGNAGLRAKEDMNNATGAVSEDLVEKATHLGRIISNDIENIPIGLVVVWSSLLTIVAAAPMLLLDFETYAIVHMIFTICWICFRVAHTVMYEMRLGVPRSVVFVLSTCCLFGLMILSVVAAFNM